MRARLRSLASLELLNIPLQAFIWFGLLGLPANPANLAGFAAFALLLLEGAAYWTAKRRQIDTGAADLPWTPLFAFALRANPVVLAAAVLFTGWSAVADPGAGSFPGLGFALFAALEHVNYFHVQLMYDNPADLRRLSRHGLVRSHLSRDLSRRRS
ncbi:hypothetical protein SAMN05216298_0521 [Glycomyces sambucus]|uniref:Uncharacterized protein n=1 Tax=Glycomyces sambucus TaxID=380244 RepID=A0A1G9CVB3_9ACTN|nr:hypothetical protein [Glycomyces sambucus]SDK55375.1 hypothetical protein SAMN05216298_0521 [Glycomyces sambucus]